MANTSDGLPAALLGAPQAQPADRSGPPGRELGTETQNVGGFGGWASFLDEQERTPELTFPQSIETYHRMRVDSQIEALSLGTFQPIREFRWMIDPNKAPKRVVENAATDLGLPIKGEDPEEDGIKRAANKFDFDRFLSDALLGSLYGFMHFEIVGEVEEAKDWRMRKLAPRHSRTVEQFRTDEVGTLLGIKQKFGQNLATIPPEIPTNKLVSFVWRPEAGSHVGRSMLRSMFPEFLVKDRTLRIAVINLQRAGGVPVIEGPQGASDDQLRDLAQMARQFKVAEGGGGSIPFGSKLTLAGGNVPDAISLLNYCNEAMARVWALMLVQLGVTQGANRALGGEFAIYAARAQRLMAKWICAGGNDFLDRYTEWNEPLADYAPLLAFEPSKPEGLSVTDLVSLLDSGALTVDPELEEWLRAEFALPDKPEPPPEGEPGDLTPAEKALVLNSRTAAPGAAPGAPAAPTYKQTPLPSKTLDPTSTAPTIASTGLRDIPRVVGGLRASLTLPDRKLRRDPTQGEIRAAVDFRTMDSAHTRAVSKLHDHYLGKVLPRQIKQLADDVREGLPARNLAAEPLGVSTLYDNLSDVAVGGARGAIREARAQGVSVSQDTEAAVLEGVREKVQAQAEHVSQLNANGLSLGAQRRAGRLVSKVRSADSVANDLEAHLTGQKHVFERENLKGAVTFAQNTGRIAAFQAIEPDAPGAVYEASEILDDKTCGPCEAIDGTVFDNADDGEAAYSSGGYVDCEGGPNCRGTLVAVYPEQNPLGGDNRLREAEPAEVQPGEGGEPIPGDGSIPGVETPLPTMGESTAQQLLDEQARDPGRYPDLIVQKAQSIVDKAPLPNVVRDAAQVERIVEPQAVTPDVFTPYFHRAYEASHHKAWLTKHEADHYTEGFLAHGGKVGGALHNTGELTADGRPIMEVVSLFNNGGPPGAAADVLRMAVEHGGNRLEAMGDHLRAYYEKNGFVVTHTMAWDDQYAPAGWDYAKDGRPSIYTMDRAPSYGTGLTEPGGQRHLPGMPTRAVPESPYAATVDSPVVRDLLTGPIDESNLGESLGTSVNQVYKTEVGGQEAFVKPQGEASGRMRSNVEPGHDAEREKMAFLVAQHMGTPSAVTVVRDLPEHGPSIISKAVGEQPGRFISLGQADAQDVHDLGLFDSIIGNTDRHGENFRASALKPEEAGRFSHRQAQVARNYAEFPDNFEKPATEGDAKYRLVAIDNGLTFPDGIGYSGGNYQLIDAVSGQPITDAEREKMRSLLADPTIRAEMKRELAPQAVANFEQRVKRLIDAPTIPDAKTLFSDPAAEEAAQRARRDAEVAQEARREARRQREQEVGPARAMWERERDRLMDVRDEAKAQLDRDRALGVGPEKLAFNERKYEQDVKRLQQHLDKPPAAPQAEDFAEWEAMRKRLDFERGDAAVKLEQAKAITMPAAPKARFVAEREAQLRAADAAVDRHAKKMPLVPADAPVPSVIERHADTVRKALDNTVVGKEQAVIDDPKYKRLAKDRARELLDQKAGGTLPGESPIERRARIEQERREGVRPATPAPPLTNMTERADKAKVKLAREILMEPGNPMGANLEKARSIVEHADAAPTVPVPDRIRQDVEEVNGGALNPKAQQAAEGRVDAWERENGFKLTYKEHLDLGKVVIPVPKEPEWLRLERAAEGGEVEVVTKAQEVAERAYEAGRLAFPAEFAEKFARLLVRARL